MSKLLAPRVSNALLQAIEEMTAQGKTEVTINRLASVARLAPRTVECRLKNYGLKPFRVEIQKNGGYWNFYDIKEISEAINNWICP